MENTIEYKGYIAVINYSAIDNLFFGKVLNSNDLINFDFKSVDELNEVFHNTIEEYILFCKEIGKEPSLYDSNIINKELEKNMHLSCIMKTYWEKHNKDSIKSVNNINIVLGGKYPNKKGDYYGKRFN